MAQISVNHLTFGYEGSFDYVLKRTKAMLAVLFSGENEFLLVDEPINHMDKQAREIVNLTPAHLYIWDEPLNYVDVFTRMQIERLIEIYKPTMLFVEHDVRFKERMANKVISL